MQKRLQNRLWTTTALLTLFGVLASCGYVSEYERQVYDWEPVYCYKSLAAVQCFKEPRVRDEKRLVNYYGPHPSRYDRPDAPDVPELQAPKEVDYWVKDEEPRPQAVPLPVKTAAQPVAGAGASSPEQPLQPMGKEGSSSEISFLDRLLKPFIGKPRLANAPPKTPVAAELTTPASTGKTL